MSGVRTIMWSGVQAPRERFQTINIFDEYFWKTSEI